MPRHRAAIFRRPHRRRNRAGAQRLGRHDRPGAAPRRSVAPPRAVATDAVNPERWQAIGDLFELALPLAAGERTALLDEACGVDEDLRREVVSLLASHNAGGGFVQRRIENALAVFHATSAAGAQPTRVGPYRLIRELGRGGKERSEERRVGKEWRARGWAAGHKKEADNARREHGNERGQLERPNVEKWSNQHLRDR